MQIDGQCHCGFVTYEAEVDPNDVSICHCSDCQTLTGSAFRVTAIARRQDVRLTSNLPKLYTKTGDNGQKRLQYFCPECGSPLFTTGEGKDADVWGVRVGSIRQRAALAPRQQIWCRSALPWIDDIRNLPSSQQD
ncbi:GFA family protein [Rhizobium sp. CG5]|uniref:GFA family protein n=1 Tax=Rhizobium sp. CG5 TaxID=2726076 RepID=UPI002033428F|nr:GFA family protein [Rhizobium sp. CG5]MCM2472558.1 GFA family protein [Rhizobium sp. CG5]